MKSQLKSIVYGASLVLVAGTVLAQSSSSPSSSSSGSSTYQSGSGQSGTMQQQQFFQAKNLIGEKVKNTQDQTLGTIKDIVFNPQNGETFAAIDVSSSRYALVPWQALNVSMKGKGKGQVVLNSTKQTLQSAPSVPQDEWQELNNPSFVQGIYSHFNLQAPTGLGGSSGAGASGTSSGSSSQGTPRQP